MYSDKQFADEICRIVDPKDVHTGAQIIRLVEEKFTSTNTCSPKLFTSAQVVDALEGCRDLECALELFRGWE